MKKLTLALTTLACVGSVLAEPENRRVSDKHGVYRRDWAPREDHKTEHEHVLSSQAEQEFVLNFSRNKAAASGFKFAQTSWNECGFDPSGNYSGIACAKGRQISVILEDFLADFVYECVDAGLRAQGGGQAADVHIVHDGILGDRNHSPQSMHAEARAIDIKSFDIKLTNGTKRSVVYAGTANRAFYTAFRSCWGNVVKRENGCPLYAGTAGRTGSIGWEDANHQRHMHTSVPYCVNGRYGSYYYQR